MATASNVSGIALEAASDLILCPCCEKRQRDPRFLPCGHTLDFKCIKQKSPAIICSVCSQRHVFVDCKNLPKDVFIRDISSLLRFYDVCQKTEKNVMCEYHSTKMFEYCDICNSSLCLLCKEIHDKVPETKRHKRFPASDLKQFPKVEFLTRCQFDKYLICTVHNLPSINWCEVCQIHGCEKCCPDSHYPMPLSERASIVEGQLIRMETKLADVSKSVEEQLPIINGARKEIKMADSLKYERQLRKVSNEKSKCKTLLFQIRHLRKRITALIAIGTDGHKASSIRHILEQNKYIFDFAQASCGSSHLSDASSLSDTSISSDISQDIYENVRYRNSLYQNLLPQNKYREETTITNINPYENEDIYEEVNTVQAEEKETKVPKKKIGKRQGKLATDSKSTTDKSLIEHKIIDRHFQFDTETRITGMTVADDIIIIASSSAKRCSGYNLQGQHQWDITEKLNSPFDLTTMTSDLDKNHIYISDPAPSPDFSKSVIHVFERKENKRYRHVKKLEKIGLQPRGITIYSGRLYVCDIFEKEILEFVINSKHSVKLEKKYGKSFLFEPMYVNVHIVSEKIQLLVSDHKLGLKTIIKGEDANDTPAWNMNDEKRFVPCKSCAGKQQGVVFIGNFTGKKIHTINFQPRQIMHQDFVLDELCGSRVVLLFGDDWRLIVGCKDGIVAIFYSHHLQTYGPVYDNVSPSLLRNENSKSENK